MNKFIDKWLDWIAIAIVSILVIGFIIFVGYHNYLVIYEYPIILVICCLALILFWSWWRVFKILMRGG